MWTGGGGGIDAVVVLVLGGKRGYGVVLVVKRGVDPGFIKVGLDWAGSWAGKGNGLVDVCSGLGFRIIIIESVWFFI